MWRQLMAGLALLLLNSACKQAIKLAPAPTLYRVGSTFPVEGVPTTLRSVDPSILYVTDRKPEYAGDQLVDYGHERS